LGERALILLLSFIVTIGSIATNIYIPALPAVRADFGVSVAEAQATFAVALVTFAIGMLCWGPISDRYGRRNAILWGIAVMSVGSAIGLLSPSIHWLIVGRAVQAFGTATGIVVARAVISDRFPAERMARTLAQLGVVAVIASGTAPVFGGLLTAAFGWRSVFVALLVVAATVGWFAWRHLPETRPPTSHPPPPREMAHAAVALLRTPLYVSCVLQASAAYAIFVVLISLAPYIMINALGRPATEYGFYYLFISIGYLLGNWGVSRFGGRGQRWAIHFGSALQLGSAVVAVALAWLGVDHPLAIFAPMGLLFFGQGLFMPHLTAIAVSLAPPRATGVGASTLGFLNQVIAALCVQLMGLSESVSSMPMLLFCFAAAALQLGVLRLSPPMEPAGRPA
jgi:DHA1 family bicyclomycin/chloramphenicol resistance-like MFS transporter